MSRARRLRGNEGCCSSDNIDSSMRGGEYWDSPYVVGDYGVLKLAGNLTKAEQDAVTLIEGGTLWAADSRGNRLSPPPAGMPQTPYQTLLARESAALSVIANGRGELNQIRDSHPMPIEWYRTNGTPSNTADRAAHKAKDSISHRALTLWCKPCTATGEDFVEALSYVGDELASGVRVFAMVVSYVPVLGTAVSFVLNAAVTLAQGEGVDKALLDAVGGSLPGQPLSKMAFDSARAIAEGKPVEQVGIALLPIDDGTKKTLGVAASIVRRIASGDNISTVALDEIYQQLPPSGKKGMDIARRVANGENVGAIAADLAANEAKNSPFGMMAQQTYESYSAQLSAMQAQYVAIRNNPGGINSFIAQSGYQGSADSLPSALRDALTAGVLAGSAMSQSQLREMKGFTGGDERDVSTLNSWAAKGQALVASGALYKPDLTGSSAFAIPLADIRAGKVPITIQYHEYWDPVSNVTTKQEWSETVTIDNDLKRRGFDVGIGFAEGHSAKTPDSYKLGVSLNNQHKRVGLEVGEQVQFQRTKEKGFIKSLDNLAATMSQELSNQDRTDMEIAAAKGVALAKSNAQVSAARSLNNTGEYRWGFDVGSGICQGTSEPGPGQTSWRLKVGPYSNGGGPYRGQRGTNQAIQGFDVAQALQHGITKAKSNPRIGVSDVAPVAAGQLITQGLSNSGSPSDLKVAVIGQTFTNPQVKAGASIAIKQGFFRKLLSLISL